MIFPSQDEIQRQTQVLEMLNRHFKTLPYEKHPNAMLHFLFRNSFDKTFGKSFQKQRISKRKGLKFREHILKSLRSRYGSYINLTALKLKDPNHIYFACNLRDAYKTDFGTLYGYHGYHSTVGEDIYYTSHSFERFEERVDPKYLMIVSGIIKDKLDVQPTAADIIVMSLPIHNFFYAKEKCQFYHIDIGLGSLVLEDFKEFFVAKTFLSPDMVPKNLDWRCPELGDNFKTFREVLSFKSFPIENKIWESISEKTE
jgi:hypothetical protein